MSEFTPIQSLARGLTLIEQLASSSGGDGLALQQLAKSINVKAPTAHNLMRTLVSRGYAEQRPGSPRYHLGPAARHLGGRLASDIAELKERVAAKLLKLHAQEPLVRFTLSEEIEGAVAITLRTAPERIGRLERSVSFPLHPYDSASAALYQALWTSEQRAAFRRRYPFSEYGSQRWSSREQFDAFLTTVRRLGYCAPPERQGYQSGQPVAAPIYDANGGIVGLIAGYLSAEYENDKDAPPLETLTRMVVDAAEELSEFAPQPRVQTPSRSPSSQEVAQA